MLDLHDICPKIFFPNFGANALLQPSPVSYAYGDRRDSSIDFVL